MRLAPDKLLHLKLGIPLAVLVAAIAYIAEGVGAGYAVAFGSVAFGIGVEVYQKIRNEGAVEVLDAVCSAAAGVALGIIIEFAR